MSHLRFGNTAYPRKFWGLDFLFFSDFTDFISCMIEKKHKTPPQKVDKIKMTVYNDFDTIKYQNNSWLDFKCRKQNQLERMRKMKSTTSAPECLTITIDEAAAILGVSRSLAYSFIEQSYRDNGPIKVLKIGKCFRVLRKSFYSYILGETEVSA